MARTRHLLPIVLCGALAALAGCQTLSPAHVPCPMPMVEQAAKIEKIVPLGTPRDQAIAKLKAAGIEGNFGAAPTIYYCDTWKQSNRATAS